MRSDDDGRRRVTRRGWIFSSWATSANGRVGFASRRRSSTLKVCRREPPARSEYSATGLAPDVALGARRAALHRSQSTAASSRDN